MKTFSSEEIRVAMAAGGVCADQVMIADREYAAPTLRWLRNEFAGALQKFFAEFGLDRWESERNDCDDFARGAAWFGSVLHVRAGRANGSSTGLLFGEFWYQRANGAGAHAINCTLPGPSRTGHGPGVIFFEPQNVCAGRDPIVQLTKEERMSCLGYRF